MKNYKEYYNKKKEALRNEAIDYQYSFEDGQVYSWLEISLKCAYFEEQGRKYGLLREFHENGIC